LVLNRISGADEIYHPQKRLKKDTSAEKAGMVNEICSLSGRCCKLNRHFIGGCHRAERKPGIGADKSEWLTKFAVWSVLFATVFRFGFVLPTPQRWISFRQSDTLIGKYKNEQPENDNWISRKTDRLAL